MPYRKRTLRGMMPVTKKVAKIIGELELATNALKRALYTIDSLEFDAKALKEHKCNDKQ